MVVGLVLGSVALSLALVLGVARRLTRRDLARSGPVFRCTAQVESGVVPGLHGRARHRQLGGWSHDVLLLRRAWPVPRLVPYPVRAAGPLTTSDDHPGAMSIRLHLDTGAVVRLSADRSAQTPLVGPFLMAEIDRLATRDS